MWTVTVEASPWKSQPQTCSRSCSRLKTWPPWEARKWEEVELFGGEGDGLAVAQDGAGGGVDFEVGDREAAVGRGWVAGAAEDGLDAGDELAGAEGLDHVVVGAELQPEEAVWLAAAGGEHDDGDVGADAEAPTDLFAGDLREHEVQDDEAGGSALDLGEGFGAGGGGADREAVALEVAADDVADGGFVVDHEDGVGVHGVVATSSARLFISAGKEELVPLQCGRDILPIPNGCGWTAGWGWGLGLGCAWALGGKGVAQR